MLWDENRAGLTVKPKGIRNIDGASIGGPIKKASCSSSRIGKAPSSAWAVSLFSVPTDDFRSGDFSRMLGPQILDARGRPDPVPTTEGGSRCFVKA